MRKLLFLFVAIVTAMSMMALPQVQLAGKKLSSVNREQFEENDPILERVLKMHKDEVVKHSSNCTTSMVEEVTDTKKVAQTEREVIKLHFEAFAIGPEYYEDTEDWYMVCVNDEYEVRLDIVTNGASYLGHWTTEDFDLDYSYLKTSSGYVDYESIDCTIEEKKGQYFAQINLVATIEGDDGTIYEVTCEQNRFTSNGIYYNILEGNKLAVVSCHNPLNEYSGEMSIPETVILDEIIYSVTSIGDYAFSQCFSLSSITIPNSVTSIGEGAFSGCSSLTSITIPNSVTSIGAHAFNGCSSLASVTIGNGVTSIESSAFNGCSSLTSLTIPNSVTSIESGAFSGCSSLASVIIGNGVTSIGWCAFESCSSITSITIPNSVTSIESSAFSGCSSLTSLTIPNSVTSIGSSAFDRTAIYSNKSNWENDVLYICNCLIKANSNISGSYTIKNNTRLIADEAFNGRSSLTSIIIPNSVTSIGVRAFAGCSSVASITIPNSVMSIGSSAFERCSSLISMVVESGNIAYDSRENCNAIIETASNTLIAGCQNTIIPNCINVIGGGAFSGCSSLTSITIPESVTSIGFSAFAGCDSLKIVICETIELPELESGIFWGIPLAEATLYVPAQSLDDYKAAAQWKDFGTILPIEEEELENELREIDMTIVFTNSEDNDSEIYSQLLTIKIPAAPLIEGFTFLKWRIVESDLTDVITIQAIYEADTPTSAEVYTNPANPAQKLLRNGQVYILQDGKTYSVMGQEM